MQIKGEGDNGLGWAEEGVSPRLGPLPRPHAVPSLQKRPRPQPHPPTRASGAAALTARPWPERSKGLPNPLRAAARDSLLDWGRGRPLVGEGEEGRAASERTSGGGGAHGQGAGREAGPGFREPPRPSMGGDSSL